MEDVLTKYCVDCKYLWAPSSSYRRCTSNNNGYDLVTSFPNAGIPHDLRSDPDKCGVDGNWFEQKEPVIEKLIEESKPEPKSIWVKFLDYWSSL